MGDEERNVFDHLDFADKSFSSTTYTYYPETQENAQSILSESPSTKADYYDHFSHASDEQKSTPENTESPLNLEPDPSTENSSLDKSSLHSSPLSNVRAFQRILNSSGERRGSGVMLKPKVTKLLATARAEPTTRYVKQLPSTPIEVGIIQQSVQNMSKEDVIENLQKYEEAEKNFIAVDEHLAKLESEIDQLSLGSSDAQTTDPTVDTAITFDDIEPPSQSLEELTDSALTSAPTSIEVTSPMGFKEDAVATLPPSGDRKEEADDSFTNEDDVPAHLAHMKGEPSTQSKRHTLYINLFKKEPSLFETQHNLENVRKITMAVTPLRNKSPTKDKVPNLHLSGEKLSKDVLATPRQILKVHLPYDQSQVLRVEPNVTVRDLMTKMIRTRLPNCTLDTLTVSYMNKEPVNLDAQLTSITSDIFLAIKSKKTAEIEAELDGSLTDSLLKFHSLISSLVDVLSSLKNVYMMELKGDKQKLISSKKFATLFFGVEAIHQLNFTILTRLSAKIGELNTTGLRSLFFLLEGCIPLYIAFATNFPQAMAILKKMQSKAKFVAAVEGIQIRLASTETLSDLLSFTLQCIPKMQLLTESLERQLIKMGDTSGDLEAVSAFLAKLPQIPLKNITTLEGGNSGSGKKTPKKK